VPTEVQPSTRTHHRLGGLLIGFAVTFLAADQLLARLRLPETPASTKAPKRMLADYAAQSPSIDVVFVGCSYTAFGIDPEAVDAAAAEQGLRIRSMNLGFGGAEALTSARLCELLLAGPQPPRVIYFELSPGILNARAPSLRYGVGQIGGPREARVLWEVSPRDRWTAVWSQVFACFHQWNEIEALMTCLRTGAPLNRPKYRRTPRGWLAWTAGVARRDATIAEEIAKRDAYWGEFAVADYALEAIVRVAELAKSQGVTLRFFEMPMSSDWTRVIRPDVAERYAAALQRLHRSGLEGPWVCPTGLIPDEEFFDSDHLVPAGAARMSRAIAEDLVTHLRFHSAREPARQAADDGSRPGFAGD
jgi:hypothetical protein